MRLASQFSGFALAGPMIALALLSADRKGFSTTQTARASAPPQPTIEDLLELACEARWDTLVIGERIARFGLALEGAPYVDGTLEGPGPEVCRLTTSGFDCVTFMELSLDLARVTTAGDSACHATPADVRAAVTFTRYRGGRLTDYPSRLHYTADWIADNQAKGVLEDITLALGGKDCATAVGFMSAHPQAYPALRANPAFVDSMRRIEHAINRLPRACIPKARVAAIEPQLRSGDLVAIATSIDGLDYAHTGLVVRDEHGVARMLHASSKHERVILDGSLSEYLAAAPKHMAGVTILRPLEVSHAR